VVAAVMLYPVAMLRAGHAGAVQLAAIPAQFMAIAVQLAPILTQFAPFLHNLAVQRLRVRSGADMGRGGGRHQRRGHRDGQGGQQELSHMSLLFSGIASVRP